MEHAPDVILHGTAPGTHTAHLDAIDETVVSNMLTLAQRTVLHASMTWHTLHLRTHKCLIHNQTSFAGSVFCPTLSLNNLNRRSLIHKILQCPAYFNGQCAQNNPAVE